EGLPMTAAIGGVLALRWVRNRADKAWFANAMLGLAGASALLFLATRGLRDLTVYCDAVSPVHLAVLCGAALGAVVLARFDPASRRVLLAGLAALAAGGGAILLVLAPQC